MNEKRMTRNEKDINMLDLQAYKVYDATMFSKVPGWSP